MAKNRFKAMDCDMHVFEPVDLWQRFIDPKFADRAIEHGCLMPTFGNDVLTLRRGVDSLKTAFGNHFDG